MSLFGKYMNQKYFEGFEAVCLGFSLPQVSLSFPPNYFSFNIKRKHDFVSYPLLSLSLSDVLTSTGVITLVCV